jgi:hypothetical protein
MPKAHDAMRVPWYPPMLIIAGAGVLLGSFMLMRQVFNPKAMLPIGAVQCILAIGIGVVATAGQIVEAARHIRRLGLRGLARSRGWFEISRLAWMLLLFLHRRWSACHWLPSGGNRPLVPF